MEKPSFKLVGAPCGHHGQYTFYKALRITGPNERIIAIGEFFFVKIWQDSELISVGELQLLWTDRVSDQTLVSVRLYFLPENTPDGRGNHGEHEVLAINDKVVLKAEDLLSWLTTGESWHWGLGAVWKGACVPPSSSAPKTVALQVANLDFTDVDKEKTGIDDTNPGVVVFSYPRYCRYRAVLARLDGIQSTWLRDSLVAALGGYAAANLNTRILYCRDTFEYPELEGHEFVCNHLAPKMKGRPRRRRRIARSRSHTPSSRSSDSDHGPVDSSNTPRRLSLRNNGAKNSDHEEQEEKKTPSKKLLQEDKKNYQEKIESKPPKKSLIEDKRAIEDEEERSFVKKLKSFYAKRGHGFSNTAPVSLRLLYQNVMCRGGYVESCRHNAWSLLDPAKPRQIKELYERYLLPFENHERKNGLKQKPNGKLGPARTIDTIELRDSPPPEECKVDEKRLRTPTPDAKPQVDNETGESKDDLNIISKPAEELNREFLDSLPKETKEAKDEKPIKISVKSVEKLIDPNADLLRIEPKTEDNKLNTGLPDCTKDGQTSPDALTRLSSLGDKYTANGHPSVNIQKSSRPLGKSSLRAVRVKPTRSNISNTSPPTLSLSESSSVTTKTSINFGIQRPTKLDDDIVEVPYKPKTPEIIDLDEYPESPQAVKKKKLDILKERGLEVTTVPATMPNLAGVPNVPTWAVPPGLTPQLISQTPMLINPGINPMMPQLFQMYNILPPSYPNGAQPPKVIQSTSLYGSVGPEKTVYGNPRDFFMPPPHVLHGTPIKSQKLQANTPPSQDLLDLTCKTSSTPSQKPAVEIVRIPTSPSPSKHSAQNLSKNYTLLDGKAVVGSNLEITLVSPKQSQTPPKNRPPQKRSSNGKFISTKTPTPPKDYPKSFSSPSSTKKTNPIVVPNYQINSTRDEVSPTSSTGSKDSQTNIPTNLLQNVFKNQPNLAQMMDVQKMPPFIDPMYMNALYSNFAGQFDQRQLALYRDLMANQFRSYPGLLNMGAVTNTPTTKN